MRLPSQAIGAYPTVSKFNELLEAVRWLNNNVITTGAGGLSIKSLPQGRAVVLDSKAIAESLPMMFGRITGCDDGVYNFVEVKIEIDYDEVGWADKAGGATGDAYNLEECKDLEDGWDIEPVPDDSVVALWPIKVGGKTVYLFTSSQWLFGAVDPDELDGEWSVLDEQDGVQITTCSTVEYSTTTHKLTRKTNMLIFDKRGRLWKAVKGTTDILIDQAVPLPE
jgi:hypothetical protein